MIKTDDVWGGRSCSDLIFQLVAPMEKRRREKKGGRMGAGGRYGPPIAAIKIGRPERRWIRAEDHCGQRSKP